MNIPVGALDGPHAIPVGRHIYVDSKASWDVIGEYSAARYSEKGEPLPLKRAIHDMHCTAERQCAYSTLGSTRKHDHT
jgi:hypothetical protein